MKRINERKEKRQIAEKSNIITEEKENRKQTKKLNKNTKYEKTTPYKQADKRSLKGGQKQ